MIALLWLLVSLLGCVDSDKQFPIKGTTYRIGSDEVAEGSEIRIDVMTQDADCHNANIDPIDDCVPYADRSHGEIRLAFNLRDPVTGTTLYRSLDEKLVTVSHNGSPQDDVELIPHEPVSSGQLFVLLIDGSGSMYENDGERAKKVYQALMNPDVIRGFLPDDNGGTGVVLLRFSSEVTGLDGQAPKVIKTAAEYRRMVKDNLMVPRGGYTHLYDAVKYSTSDLLKVPAISRFLSVKAAQPTLVVLTDGFNNQAANDTCGTNVDRLNDLLTHMNEGQKGSGVSARSLVFTIGLGLRYRKGEKPKGFNQTVTPTGLCGKYINERIDGRLEKQGIDHVSLAWIAEAGRGISFVKQKTEGLAEVFQRASRSRYRWYEARYRVPDVVHHRRSFDVRISLLNLARAETTVRIFPSPWFDAPPGTRDPGERWTRGTPFMTSLAVVMPIFGALVFLMYIGPAFFNARRAVFRRARIRDASGASTDDTPPDNAV